MTDIKDRIRAIARRVESNVPQHADPDRFHEEKSDIVEELRALAKETRN